MPWSDAVRDCESFCSKNAIERRSEEITKTSVIRMPKCGEEKDVLKS